MDEDEQKRIFCKNFRRLVDASGKGLMELGSSITLGGGSEKDWARLQAYYLRALVEQAFIMIRQLDRIEKNQK